MNMEYFFFFVCVSSIPSMFAIFIVEITHILMLIYSKVFKFLVVAMSGTDLRSPFSGMNDDVVCKRTIDFCVFILYIVTLLNSHVNSNRYLVTTDRMKKIFIKYSTDRELKSGMFKELKKLSKNKTMA